MTKNSTEETLVEEPIEDQTKKSRKSKKSTKKNDDQAKLEELDLQLAEAKDKYLRLFAEFDNYKKRTLREKLDFMRTAAQDTIMSILPVLDDFDRAKKSADDEASKEQFSEGVLHVYNKLYQVLNNLGLEVMESTGQKFDPEFHEAITEVPAPSKKMRGRNIDTVEKGYLLKEKIIRYAKVVVGK